MKITSRDGEFIGVWKSHNSVDNEMMSIGTVEVYGEQGKEERKNKNELFKMKADQNGLRKPTQNESRRGGCINKLIRQKETLA